MTSWTLEGVSSYYVLSQSRQAWLGNWESDRILRFDPTDKVVSYWQLRAGGEPVDIEVVGLALDDKGHLW